MAKLPALQFYTGDWMKDPGLRSVSYAARGLWIDMLCLMSECNPRGFLKVNDKPLTHAQVARMTGGTSEEVSHLLQELESAGVFSTDRHSVIYSRRIVKDEELREVRRKCGKLGGNPNLVNQKPTTGVNHPSNQKPTPSSSSSSSSSEKPADAGPPGRNGRNAAPPQRKSPTGPHAEAVAHYVSRWRERYGRTFQFRPVDGEKIAVLLKACGNDAADAKRVIDRFFANHEEFYRGHPLTKLTSADGLPRFLADPGTTSGAKPLTKAKVYH